MRLTPTELQQEIADSAADLFGDRFGTAAVRQQEGDADAIDQARWDAVGGMGWFGLLVPEQLGGLGLGAADAVMLFREAGRYLAPTPICWTTLAAQVAASAGRKTIAEALGVGAVRTGLAVADFAIDVRAGDLLLSLDANGARLEEVESVEPLAAADPGVRLARVGGRRLAAEVSGPEPLRLARLLVAAQLLGLIEAARDMSAAYATMRQQFGKPIGSFQAVKHRCADMAIAAYAVRAQLMMAAHRHDQGLQDTDFHAAAALTLAIDRAVQSTADNIQNHGAIGFTAEHDAHQLVKRTLTLERALGPRRAALSDVLAPARHDFY